MKSPKNQLVVERQLLREDDGSGALSYYGTCSLRSLECCVACLILAKNRYRAAAGMAAGRLFVLVQVDPSWKASEIGVIELREVRVWLYVLV